MADFPGTALPDTLKYGAPSPNRTQGLTVPRFSRNTAGKSLSTAQGVNNYTFVEANPVQPGESYPGTTDSRRTTSGLYWFDKMHIFPRDGIAFGTIISTSTAEFEIFNAFGVEVELTVFLNNVGTGVSIPELSSLPRTFGPLTSFLSSSSTRLMPVLPVVQVEPEGPSDFNGTLEFIFSLDGPLYLQISGTRIAFMSPVYEASALKETLEFLTNIVTETDGTESNRIQERDNPRQILEVDYVLDGDDRRRMQTQLFAWQGRQFAVPLITEDMIVSVAVSSGSVVTVESTADVDLRVGGYAAIQQRGDSSVYDVLEVVSFDATTITLLGTIQNSYVPGDRVCPVRLAKIRSQVRGGRYPVNVEAFRVAFTVTDNSTGALTGSTSGFSTYNGKVLMDCNIVQGVVQETFDLEIDGIDSESGLFSQEPLWDRNKRGSTRTIFIQSRSDLYAWRRLLIELGGRRKSFYEPTVIEDLIVTQNIVSSNSTVDIENVGYTSFVQSREPKKTIHVTFTDGTSIDRVILSSVELSADEERLTVDSVWGVNKTPSEVERVEFYEESRFDSDSIVIQHEEGGQARIRAPIVTLIPIS